MATLFTPTDEFIDVVDGLQAVTLVPRSGSSTSIAHAKRRAVSLREAAASSGKYTQADATWHLHYSELATPPLLGDRIRDGAGAHWTILEVGRETRNTRWRCVSRDLAIVAGLNTQVAIERATSYLTDEHGAREPVYEVVKYVHARIQTEAGDNTTEHDARYQRMSYRITLAEATDITSNDRVRDDQGRTYKIQSVDGIDELDALPSLRAVRNPWPFS